MDSGLSWADQWNNNDTPGPPPQPASQNDKTKGKDGNKNNNIGKKILGLKWMIDLRKKPQK